MVVGYSWVIAVQHFLNDPQGEINTSNLQFQYHLLRQYMQGDNSINTSSLAGKERLRKASKIRKKWSNLPL